MTLSKVALSETGSAQDLRAYPLSLRQSARAVYGQQFSTAPVEQALFARPETEAPQQLSGTARATV